MRIALNGCCIFCSIRDAAKDYEKAISIKPDEPDANLHFRLGICYLKMGLAAQAESQLQIANTLAGGGREDSKYTLIDIHTCRVEAD